MAENLILRLEVAIGHHLFDSLDKDNEMYLSIVCLLDFLQIKELIVLVTNFTIPVAEFLRNRMEFNLSQTTRKLVSRGLLGLRPIVIDNHLIVVGPRKVADNN